MEKTLILDTLTHCLGNRTHAANILGISIRTLRNKLNEYADEGTQIMAPQNGIAASAYSSNIAPDLMMVRADRRKASSPAWLWSV